MKRLLLFAAAAAIAFTSCMKTEVTEQTKAESNNAIDFGTYIGKATRGSVAYLQDLQDANSYNGFGVIATHSGVTDFDGGAATGIAPNFMFNQQVTWNDPNWEYSPLKYWPEAQTVGDNESWGKVSFFAYSPYNGAGVTLSSTQKGYPTIAFEVEPAAADQIDLLTAKQLNRTKANNAGKVQMTFNHILSRIGFSARLNAELAQGTTTYTVNTVNVYYKDDLVAQKATYAYNESNGEWYSNDVQNFGTGVTAGQINSGDITLNSETANYTEAKKLNTDANYMFMIPQTIGEGDLYVDVKYTVTTTDAVNAANSSTVVNQRRVSIPAGTWEMGKAYNYIMVFTPSAIEFNVVEVVDWDQSDVMVSATTNVAQINAILAGVTGNGNGITVTTTAAIGEIDNNTIVLPAGDGLGADNNTHTPSVTLNLAGGVATGSVLTINDAVIGATTSYNGDVNIIVPASTTGAMITVTAPLAHITINGGTWLSGTVWSSNSTCVVAAGTTIGTLNVWSGNVAIYGTVGSIVNNTGGTVYVTIYDGGEWTNRSTQESTTLIAVDNGKIVMNGQNYPSIAAAVAAIDAATSESTIELAAGTYTDPKLNIPTGKTITIKAQTGIDAEQVIFQGQMCVNGQLKLYGITIDNTDATTSSAASVLSRTAIALTAHGTVEVDKCIFNLNNDYASVGSGIKDWWTVEDHPQGGDATITNTIFNCNGCRPLQLHENATIEGCTFNNPYRYCIQINSTKTATVIFKNNKMVKNTTGTYTNSNPAFFIQLTSGGSEGAASFTGNHTFVVSNNTFEGTSMFLPYVYETGSIKAEAPNFGMDDFVEIDDKAAPVATEVMFNSTTSTYYLYGVNGMQWLAKTVNTITNTFAGKIVNLMTDLDMSGIMWTPIGNVNSYSGQTFKGTFDGCSHTIDHFTAENYDDNYAATGLFGSLAGTVKNLNFTNVNIKSTHYTGVVCGFSSTDYDIVIDNCHVDGGSIATTPELISGSYDNGDKVGGIIGYCVIRDKITNCSVKNLSITGYRDLGGIVGCGLGEANNLVYVTNCKVENVIITQDNTNGYKADPITTYETYVGRHNTYLDTTDCTNTNVTLRTVN